MNNMIVVSVPFCTKERFSLMTGVTISKINHMIANNQLPTIERGSNRQIVLINLEELRSLVSTSEFSLEIKEERKEDIA